MGIVMITWADKVAFVGMIVEIVNLDKSWEGKEYDTIDQYHIRVRIPGGVCSYGDGASMEKAIESAAIGMNMDWYSIEGKMTEHEWERMSHV